VNPLPCHGMPLCQALVAKEILRIEAKAQAFPAQGRAGDRDVVTSTREVLVTGIPCRGAAAAKRPLFTTG
jgi:hypothetical protein